MSPVNAGISIEQNGLYNMSLLVTTPSTALSILDRRISDDGHGRYSLNDLHRAAVAAGKASAKTHQPHNFMRRHEAVALIDAISRRSSDLRIAPVETIKGGQGTQGTYGVKAVVYAYAMWIDADFNLDVIEAFDATRSPSGINADLYAQALQAERDEAKSFALGQTGSRLMLLRKSEKKELQEQVCLMREAVQLRLALGFGGSAGLIGVAA